MDIASTLSLQDYSLMAAQRCCHGPCEGESLPLDVLLNWASHPYGWEVKGFAERQWLAAYCPACGYWNSFWQLGIRGALRPSGDETINRSSLVKTKDPDRRWNLIWAGCTASIVLGLVLTDVALDRAAAREASGQVVPACVNR